MTEADARNGFAETIQCSSCQADNLLNRAANFFATAWGEICARVRHPYYSDLMAPAFGQPHRTRDGVPWTGLLPTIRIDAPSNPDLTLNIVTATTWYLRATPRYIPAPTRRTLTPYSQRRNALSGHWGRSN